MGRSVSYPRNTAALAFTHLEYDEDEPQMQWDDFLCNLKEAVEKEFPVRWRHADEWQDENHGILKCDYALLGVSEYCGIVSVWLIAAPEEEDEDATETLARGLFLAVAQDRLQCAVSYANGDSNLLRKVGTFSNGEGVYERVR